MMHVGELVLDRLVGADDAAELAALLGVVDRRVQHRLPGADQLRRGGQRAELEGPCHVGRPAVAGGGDVEQLSARVDRLVLVARGARRVTCPSAGEQDQPGGVGVDRARDLRAASRPWRSARRRPARRRARRRRAESVPPRWIR